ncbi:MAG TPA: hypothetical protein VLZ77_14030, partial [Acidimicrobiales bacterium]|nr:hypothetical protein [Acidimicrobiales bacterium]
MSDAPAAGGADPSAQFRLPYTVEPTRYAVRLAPDLGAATFRGEVRVDVEVHEATTEIEMHAAELVVTRAQLSGHDGTLEVVMDEARERMTLRAGRAIGPGPASVELEFSGVLNDQLHGFYRSAYTDDAGVQRSLATTQFEATDARRAFPCFDEPDRKAVFSITLDVPEGLAAFSNGPAVEEAPLEGGGRRVRFGDTIPMSTYLVAFVVGPLEATAPMEVRGIPVRVVHAPGKGPLTAY